MGGHYISLYSKRDAVTWYHFATGINSGGMAAKIGELSTLNPDSIYLNFYAREDQNY